MESMESLESGPAPDVPDPDRERHDVQDHEGSGPASEQPRPDEASAVQARLPLDLDAPIPFELTARARRVVAPSSLPPLEVVPEPELGERGDGLDTLADPSDTRAARARALRRAGLSVDGIARELSIDAHVVASLVDDVAPVASARRRLRAVDGGRVTDGVALEDAAETERLHQRFERARRRAQTDGTNLLSGQEDAAVGLGLVLGTARIDPHAVLIRLADRDLAVPVGRWLRTNLLGGDVTKLRVIVRVAPQLPGDVQRHAWADSLGVPVERVTVTRWRTAPTPDAVEASVRLGDAEVAGRLAGLRDAALRVLSGSSDR